MAAISQVKTGWPDAPESPAGSNRYGWPDVIGITGRITPDYAMQAKRQNNALVEDVHLAFLLGVLTFA
jgi:hypothetical protein